MFFPMMGTPWIEDFLDILEYGGIIRSEFIQVDSWQTSLGEKPKVARQLLYFLNGPLQSIPIDFTLFQRPYLRL